MIKGYVLNNLKDIKDYVLREEPLIHYITNHISMNDCANVILSIGGKAIMAEHKEEVEEITSASKALGLNLGNITDGRMESMKIAASYGNKKGIPMVLDIVGVNCSSLRLNYALDLIKSCKPNVIKGNMTEIKSVLFERLSGEGIDVTKEDKTSMSTLDENIKIVESLAKKTGSVVISTGAIDIVAYEDGTYIIENGVDKLSRVTGTGCMVTALIATFISSGQVLNGAILSLALMGIAGEKANGNKGMFSFKGELLDNISTLTYEDIIENIKIKKV